MAISDGYSRGDYYLPDDGSGGHDAVGAIVDWVIGKGFHPTGFLTLTFDRKRSDVSMDSALWWWRWLVRRLNEGDGGLNYRRKWGHSWFSYVMAVERHRDNWPHVHALVEGHISFAEVHRLWGNYCGFAWTRSIVSERGSLFYVLKYVAKEGSLRSVWFQPLKRDRVVLGGVHPARSG